MLAAGWYSGGHRLGASADTTTATSPRLLAQLEIELADGTIQTIATDGSWKTAFGPYVEGEFLAGETYDATKEIPGWASPGLNDAAWQPVAVTESIPAKLQAFPGVTVQETGVLRPVKITEPKPGVYVFDLGQNFAGFARLKVRGPAGTKVVLRFAEVLNPDGTIYTTNLRGARATDTYVLKGEGEEVWQPRFTFHGFRYVEVTGYPGKPGEDAITGIAINSNIPLVGSFECSSPMVNRLYQNIVWTQRANFISVPTDCPQRDERLGWTGDAETFVRAATYNADVAAFFTKWLVDLEDAQRPDGEFPDVAPRVVDLGGGVAAWADAGTICPWTIYQVYNDRRLLEKHYAAMVRWVEYCRKNSKDLLRPAAGFGDWLSIKADTPLDVIATAYFAYSTHLTAEAARTLGKQDDARKYDELFQQIKEAFNKAYVAPDGRIKGNTQTCYVLALWFDLLPTEKRAAAVRYLVDDIKSRDTHLSTGFVGTSVLMPTLSADRQHAAGLQAAAERHVPLLGLLDQARRHEHLGAVGRLDPGEGFSGPRHELVRPLFVRRGGPVDVPDRGRHRHGRAGLPAAGDPAAAGRRAHLGEGQLPLDPRPDRHRVEDRGRQADLGGDDSRQHDGHGLSADCRSGRRDRRRPASRSSGGGKAPPQRRWRVALRGWRGRVPVCHAVGREVGVKLRPTIV